MRRRALIALFAVAVGLGSGCTASDRDYMRNHIVSIDSPRHAPETSLENNSSPIPSSATR